MSFKHQLARFTSKRIQINKRWKILLVTAIKILRSLSTISWKITMFPNMRLTSGQITEGIKIYLKSTEMTLNFILQFKPHWALMKPKSLMAKTLINRATEGTAVQGKRHPQQATICQTGTIIHSRVTRICSLIMKDLYREWEGKLLRKIIWMHQGILNLKEENYNNKKRKHQPRFQNKIRWKPSERLQRANLIQWDLKLKMHWRAIFQNKGTVRSDQLKA